MTLTSEHAAMQPPAPAPAPAATPTLRASGRRALFWIIASVGTILVAVVALIITGTASVGGTSLGRTNAAADGAMALAEVLSQQGVTVETVATLDAALAAVDDAQSSGSGATLFVADVDGFLTHKQANRLAGVAQHLVVADPHFELLQALAPEIGFGGVSTQGEALRASSDCSIAAARRAGAVAGRDGDGLKTLSIAPDASNYSGCFSASNEDDLASPPAYALVQRSDDSGVLSFVADRSIFANASITEEGNAALALGLLGEHPTLVWYQPTLADVETSGPPSLAELSPGWVTPVMVLLLLVGIAASVAYGRRFGALVVENLPVTVRASETMEGRARLYARHSARLHAIDSLRIGAVGRIARALGLSRTATVDEVVMAAASSTKQDPRQVSAILIDERPSNDAQLLALSDRLLALERAVHSSVTPGDVRSPHTNERMEP